MTQLEEMCCIILAAQPSSKANMVYIDLDGIAGVPIMPTLSGWLLQYPVIYLADRDTANTMAQLLSDTILVLHDVQLNVPLVEVTYGQCAFSASQAFQQCVLPICLHARRTRYYVGLCRP